MSQNTQTPPPIVQQQSVYEDEISLVDIVNVLLRRKKLMLGVMLATFCIGLFYAFSQARVYQVETILSPPSHEIIQSFNLRNLQNINKSDIFSRFGGIIYTRAFQQEFFNKFNLIETFSDIPEDKMEISEINRVFEGFSDSLKVIKKDKKNNIKISLEGIDKNKLGAWLDDFVVFADSKIVNQITSDMQASINYKIKKLKREIRNKRFFYNQKREDELERLLKDYNIAKNLGIIERSINKNMISSDNNLSIYMNGSTKRYMEGTKILHAEMLALKNRGSDDAYISGLRDLQNQLTKLEEITIQKDKLHAVTIDKKAIVNIVPIRPKRKLIVIISLILGGMLGLFGVFIVEFISNLKKQTDRVDVV